MKIRKEAIREDRYLNLKLDTYPVDFTFMDSIFYDLTNFNYCIVMNDGEQDIFLEYSNSKQEALQKHKEYYERVILRSEQWFDVKSRKFKYVKYKDADIEEKVSDIKTIETKDLYSSFIKDAQAVIVKGSNNGLTFYTKREATNYSRKVAFSIFSGLRVKIGQLRNTSYAELKQTDAKAVDTFVKQTDNELATRFLTAMYNASSEEHQGWEMFVDLVEAKIAEYYKEGNRTTGEAPNYIILEEIVREIESRLALTRKPDTGTSHAGGADDKADWSRRFPTNTPGKFYVDEKCIVCDACAATAPKFFKLNEQHAFVSAQPSTPEEIELCNKALAGCPVAAIGNDGDAMAAAASAPAPKDPERTSGSNLTENKAGPASTTVDITMQSKDQTTPVTVTAHVMPTAEGVAGVVSQLNNIGADVISITPENREKEIEELKGLLGNISVERLAEIKAMIRMDELKRAEAQAAEQTTVAEPVASVVEAPVVEEVPASGAKPLPATSPDGSAIFPENVPGMFYVDDKCIECDACVGAAPNSFVIEDGHAYVFAQPLNDKEIEDCKEAMAGCPVDAIHIND